MHIETEAERRYEMDQIIASARLEGGTLSEPILKLFDQYVRGETTQPEMQRLARDSAFGLAGLAAYSSSAAAMLPAPDSNSLDPYTHKGTSDLINKVNLRVPAVADQFEFDAVAVATNSLDSVLTQGPPSMKKFKAIHAHLFGDVYAWAGQFRTVNISKGTSSFARVEYLESEGRKLFERLAADNYYKGSDKAAFVEKLTAFFGDINALHPFREGNGRATRPVLNDIAHGTGFGLDQRHIDKTEWNQSSSQTHRGDYTGIAKVFSAAVRPLRAIAFANMERNSAIGRFPELAGAYALFDALLKRSTADYPNNRLAHDKFAAQARDTVQRQLETGKVPSEHSVAKTLG